MAISVMIAGGILACAGMFLWWKRPEAAQQVIGSMGVGPVSMEFHTFSGMMIGLGALLLLAPLIVEGLAEDSDLNPTIGPTETPTIAPSPAPTSTLSPTSMSTPIPDPTSIPTATVASVPTPTLWPIFEPSVLFFPDYLGFDPGVFAKRATIKAEAIPEGTTRLSVNIQHPETIGITEPVCQGPFAESLIASPRQVAGGTLLECFVALGLPANFDGSVLEFRVDKPVEFEVPVRLTMLVGSRVGETHFSDGTLVWLPETNELVVGPSTTQPEVTLTYQKDGKMLENVAVTHSETIEFDQGTTFSVRIHRGIVNPPTRFSLTGPSGIPQNEEGFGSWHGFGPFQEPGTWIAGVGAGRRTIWTMMAVPG